MFVPLATARRSARRPPNRADRDADASTRRSHDRARRSCAARSPRTSGPLGDLTAALVPAGRARHAPTSSPGPRACSPAPRARPRCSRSSTRTCVVTWLLDDGDAVGPGHEGGPASAARCGRCSPASAPRSTSCATCRASPPPPAASWTPPATARRVWDTRKTLPGPARGREGGGARRGRREPPRLAVGLRAGEGQPPRRPHASPRRSSARTHAGRAARSRSSATASSRCEEAVAAGATMVLLDNMTPDEVRARASSWSRRRVLVEVSGGVTLDNVRAYADAGADLVSTSVITQSAPALDLAFDLATRPRPEEERRCCSRSTVATPRP